jgi:hypothetical protein
MKTIKNIILFLLVITFPMLSFSQEENTDAVYDKLIKEYTLNPDGTMEFRLHKELRLLTHFAFHRLFGETFIIYDPTYQELKINEAYTIMADGKRVEAPENAFNEVLPRFARNIPAYNHLREMVVTHTGLEVGATIFLDYTIITKNPFIPYLMGNEAIGENVPVKEMEVIVTVPPDVALSHKMLNLRTAPEISSLRTGTKYSWKFRGLKANPMESHQNPVLAPRLLFSTAKDLQQVYFKFVDQMAFRSMASSLAKKNVKDLFTGDEDDLTKMRVLQKMVVNEVSLANIPFEYTGFKVREPAVAWQQANATPLEKALLLCDMLLQVNINAIPVALIPNNEFDKALGNLLSFEQFMVQVNPREMERFYLSVTEINDQDLIYKMEGYTGLQLDGAIESLRTFQEMIEERDDEISLEGELTLANTGVLTGELAMELEGANNPFLKLSEDADAAKKYLSGGLNSSAVKSYQIEELTVPACEVTFTLEQNDAIEKVGEYYSLNVPGLSNSMARLHLEGMSDKRETAVKLPGMVDEEYSFTITLPEGWELLTPEAKFEMENEVGSLKISIHQKKDKLEIEKELEINQDISFQQYAGFLELVRNWTDERYSRLILKQGE